MVSWGRSLCLCEEALSAASFSAELIDLRSLYPYDWALIKDSFQKTRRLLIVNEDTEVANFGEHLALRASQEGFYDLIAPPAVLAGKHIPGIGLHPELEKSSVPQPEDILLEAKKLVETRW